MPRRDRADRHTASRRDFAVICRRQPEEQDSRPLLFRQRYDRSFEVAQFQPFNLLGRTGQSRRTVGPFDHYALTGGSADLADVLVVEDHDQPRSQIPASSPEMSLREGPSDALLDEIIGSDRIAGQTSPAPPNVR